jgi:hypothetical protein
LSERCAKPPFGDRRTLALILPDAAGRVHAQQQRRGQLQLEAAGRFGDRPHLYCQLLVGRRRKGEPRGFSWQDYRDLIVAAHRQLAAPLVWCWDNHALRVQPG